MDLVLSEAALDALHGESTTRDTSINLRRRINQLRSEEHGVHTREINLLDFYYCSESLSPIELVWLIPEKIRRTPDYFIAYSRNSKFSFIGDRATAVELCVVCRLPHHSLDQSILSIEINGSKLSSVILNHEWQKILVALPSDSILSGLNEIVLLWPMPSFPGAKAIAQIFTDIAFDDWSPTPYCSFGEVHALFIRPVANF